MFHIPVPVPGFDTISTALSWAVLYLVAYPEIQQRLHEEISKCDITFIDTDCTQSL